MKNPINITDILENTITHLTQNYYYTEPEKEKFKEFIHQQISALLESAPPEVPDGYEYADSIQSWLKIIKK